MAVQTIYVVFKTHFDIGFTELAEELVKRWDEEMFPAAFDVCEATQGNPKGRRYVWTMPSWPLASYLERKVSQGEDAARAEELIRRGQIAWHALPFTTHTEFCGLEEYIRGMYFSAGLSREFGRRPVSAKMTDVLGHTWMLPSLLAKAGVRFLHLGPNSALYLPDVPELFFWEGPDGGRVLTFYNKAGGYGSSLVPPEGWPFPVWLALMQTNDNLGPQGPEAVDEILLRMEKEAPGTKAVIGTLDDFWNALSTCPLDGVPVVRADIADTWIHGTGSMPETAGSLRALRRTLEDTEKAFGVGFAYGLFTGTEASGFAGSIAKAYENSLLFGEHTWGLNTLYPTFKLYDRYYAKEDFEKNGSTEKIERSWDEHRQYYLNANAEVERTAPAVLDAIAAAVDAHGPRLVAVSGLGWRRDAWVDVEALRVKLQGKTLVVTGDGCEAPVRELDGRLHAYVKELPALGYRTISLMDGKAAACTGITAVYADAASGRLENRWYSIGVDAATGTISSLFDKARGYEWVGASDRCVFAQYRYIVHGSDEARQFLVDCTERFYDWQVNALVRKDYFDQKRVQAVPAAFSVEAEASAGSASLVMKARIAGESVEKYGNARGLSLRITLYDDMPYIDLQFGIRGKEKTFCVESGHFTFPLNLQSPQYRINKMGSVIDPEADIAEGANHSLYCCENWVDISDGERGMAFVPYDTHLFSIGSPGILRYRRAYVREEPALWFNAFNNSYGCNFPQWMGGDYSFRYRLIPHEGDWRRGNVQRLAFESVAPPLAGFAAEGGEKRLPAALELIHELDGMQALCFKPAETGEGYLLRLRELSGQARAVMLSFGRAVESLERCDLLENALEKLELDSNGLTFQTNPFEIHSFLVKFGEGNA